MGIYIMSDIFLKNKNDTKLSDFLDTEAASTSSLPQWLSVVDKQEGGNNELVSSPGNSTELELQLKEEFQKLGQEGGKRRRRKVDVTEDKPKKRRSSKKSSKKKSSKKSSKKASKKSSKKGSKKLKRLPKNLQKRKDLK